MFIRAPRIRKVGDGINVLATHDNESVIVEQKKENQYLLGATCHPEMSTSKVHEYFLKKILEK
jgi:glutamine amidotransferase PdxT